MQNGSVIGFTELEQRGLQLESERNFVEARDVFDAALKLDPQSQSCAEARARVALGLREATAVQHCARALAFHRSNPERQLRMIATAAVELGNAAFPLLEEYIRAHRTDPAGHEIYAEIRAEWGAGDQFVDSYIDALKEDPANRPMWMSYWNMLTRAGRLNEALMSMDEQRSLFEGDRDFAMLEVNTANHAGLTDRLEPLLDRLDNGSDAQIARAQYRLRKGDLRESAKLLEGVLGAEADNLTAWSLLELIWRILDDPLHDWLIGDPPLYGTREIALSASELTEIAGALRSLHRSPAQPIGQSVRGGTQTSGQLFIRPEPQVSVLTDALAAAIRDFFGELPQADPKHPLLRYRDMGVAFGPSWSVRFTGEGQHAAHIHPNGILSSACYIVVPEAVSDEIGKAGWLELGKPPPELGIDLPPLEIIQPRPGRLVLFPSFLFHATRPFSGGERLSAAFDLVPVPADW